MEGNFAMLVRKQTASRRMNCKMLRKEPKVAG